MHRHAYRENLKNHFPTSLMVKRISIMNLTNHELSAIKSYILAIQPHYESKNVLRDCKLIFKFLMKAIVEKEGYLKEFIDGKSEADARKIRDNPVEILKSKNFFGVFEKNGKLKPKSQVIGKLYEDWRVVARNRNDVEHTRTTDDDEIKKTADENLRYTDKFLKWYFTKYNKTTLRKIDNLASEEKNKLEHIFTDVIDRKERIIERETYYVVLLIDSSSSMLWPFLDDQSNYDNESSNDYKNAILEVQGAMQIAHKKALEAFRGSSICKDGYLKLYQYTFNHKKKLLNIPEELSASGYDKVVKLERSNYYPEGMTALYDVIEESLKIIFHEHLEKTMEKENRIDKVCIGVITDGEDTIIEGINCKNKSEYEARRAVKVKSILETMKLLRGNGDIRKCFLASSVLIGLTGSQFSEKKLKEIKKELSFDTCISIKQSDDHSIRQAFKLFSTNAVNT